jgi:hypothetical protein
MSTNALAVWNMDAGPTSPTTKAALPPHKGGPSLGATSPAPKATMIPDGMDLDTALEKLIDARLQEHVSQTLYWSNIVNLLAAGDAAGAVNACLKAIVKAMQDAAVGLDFETALSSQASRTFDEPLMVLNENEEIRFTIERRPIRPQIKQGTANPAPKGAGVNALAAVGNASSDDIPVKHAPTAPNTTPDADDEDVMPDPE